MAADDSFLEDNVVLQSLGPLDEALHSGVAHIWLALVVTCCRPTPPQRFNPVILLRSHCHVIIPTCDEDLGFTAACEVGQRPFRLTHPHLSANKVGHCGRQSGDETAAKYNALFSVLVYNYWEDKYISTFIPKTTL